MTGSKIHETRKMMIDGYTITFAAGVKHGRPLVVFGIYTNDDTIPVVTLEKEHPSLDHALGYVRAVTEKAGIKLLAYYLDNFSGVVARISTAMNSKKPIYTRRDSTRNVYYKS